MWNFKIIFRKCLKVKTSELLNLDQVEITNINIYFEKILRKT